MLSAAVPAPARGNGVGNERLAIKSRRSRPYEYFALFVFDSAVRFDPPSVDWGRRGFSNQVGMWSDRNRRGVMHVDVRPFPCCANVYQTRNDYSMAKLCPSSPHPLIPSGGFGFADSSCRSTSRPARWRPKQLFLLLVVVWDLGATARPFKCARNLPAEFAGTQEQSYRFSAFNRNYPVV